MGWMRDESGLDKTAANHVALTPLSHLRRAAGLFADRDALVQGNRRYTYRQYHDRVSRLASALSSAGIGSGDVVATIIPNVIAQAEAHFGVPACGAVLNTINTRLDVSTIAYILDHGEARLLMVDTQFLEVAEAAITAMEGPAPRIIEVEDSAAGYPASGRHTEYEAFIAAASPDFDWILPTDEWESISLNYTSGTTGRPKGVVCHHRGAYLMTIGTAVEWQLGEEIRYIAIVPLFHCNGWNHTWMLPIFGGTWVACRDISAKAIFDAIADEGVNRFGGAPIVLNLLVNARDEDRRAFDHTVRVLTAGAPPAPAILEGMSKMGFVVMQAYGLTETYGHVTECMWKPEWDDLPMDEKAAIMARQGIGFPILEDVKVVDSANNQIPMDGVAQGEIVMRGNTVMKGYLKNPEATAEAFAGGYFHSGDIAVQHPDGYVQIADRAKDIIISGGENISSVEVEGVLMAHPAVSLCAVVAKPDEKWGEVPCAFVELKDGTSADEAELIAFVRERLAGFKTPKKVVFQELPKTSTGKIQKFELRGLAKTL